MKDRARQLNVPKMPWALRHALATRLTLEIPVNCSHPRIHQTAHLRLVRGLVQNLRKLDLCNGVRFDFFWRENPKLYLLHFTERCRGMRKSVAQHDDEAAERLEDAIPFGELFIRE